MPACTAPPACWPRPRLSRRRNPRAQARVACVNLHLVLKGYAKTKIYDAEVEAIVSPLRKQGEDIKDNIKKYEAGIREPKTGPELKDQYEKAIIAYKQHSGRPGTGRRQKGQQELARTNWCNSIARSRRP